MKISDDRLAVLLDSYTWLARNPSSGGRNDRANSDAEHASIIRELQEYRAQEAEGKKK